MDKEHHIPSRIRPLVIFDGDCGFCRRWIDRWREETGDAVDYAPYQDVAARFPDVPLDAFRHAVHFVDAQGRIHRGAEAVFHTLAVSPVRSLPLLAYRHVPGIRVMSEAAYRWVAAHRPLTDRWTLMLWGRDVRIPTYRIASDFFLRGLGLVYIIAFLSLCLQVRGLIGASGILPAAEFLGAVKHHFGAEAWRVAPTLAWFNASDPFLVVLCLAGAACGGLAMAGVLALPALALAWLSYLSLSVAGQTFLGFQWDNLLLEAGFLALFIAPLRVRARSMRERPSRFGLFLLRWLLFRLMFSSGVVKLSSGDAAWRHLAALRFHWETQCLPTWMAWYAHLLPELLQSLATIMMFGIELVLPFFLFLPRKPRLFACFGFVVLQVLIALTGNYTFFNLLTVVLCVLLIDDAVWPGLAGRIGARNEPATGVSRPVDARAVIRASRTGALALLWLLSLVPLAGALRTRVAWPDPLLRAHAILQPFRSVNGYGLFAVMTTTRSEISIEGSLDGLDWRTYPFRWKPGDPSRKPAFVAPHQPRLDWQMWFAALGDYRASPWLERLEGRLLEGSEPVLDLFSENPFPDAPPRYIRTRIADYRFASPEQRQTTGDWWVRSVARPFGPTLARNRPGTP